MDKNLKKFKDNYLEELVSDDRTKEQLRNKLGVKEYIPEPKNTFFTNHKKPIIFGGSAFVLVVVILVTIFSVINYRNTPAYQRMLANNEGEARLSLHGHKDGFKNMTEDIENQIGVVVDDRIICYADPGEEIIITVQIENPKFFEILSFTLNGRLYQSYEFQDGSDSTQIKVKFTTQETSGIQQITIDAIKYVDDTTIKNARFDGERTIQVGVTYQNVPAVSSVSEIANTTSFGLSFVVTDPDNLINVETGLKIYLFDSEKLIQTTDLKLGMNVVPYSNLRLGSDYAYLIVGVFDLFDGEGKKAYVLHQNAFTTEEGFAYKNVTSTYDSINIDYASVEGFNGELNKLDLYLGEELVSTIDPTVEGAEFAFTGLKSNMEYTIKTSYKYTIVENDVPVEVIKDIEHKVKTMERPVPVVEFVEKEITKDSIEFEYNIQDTTDVGKIIKIEMFNRGASVSALEEDVRLFENLLSDNDYTFVVTYQYDLLDDTGVKTLTAEYTFHTEPKVIPTAVFTQAVGFNGILYSDIYVVDPDSIYELIAIEVYNGDEFVKSIETPENYIEINGKPGQFQGNAIFTGLEKGIEYTLVIKYKYDLHDGNEINIVDKDHPTAENKIKCTIS